MLVTRFTPVTWTRSFWHRWNWASKRVYIRSCEKCEKEHHSRGKKPNQNTDEEKYNAEGNVQMKAFDRLKPRIIWNFIRLWCIASGSIFQEIYLIACFKKTALICFKYGKRPATIVSRATAEKKKRWQKNVNFMDARINVARKINEDYFWIERYRFVKNSFPSYFNFAHPKKTLQTILPKNPNKLWSRTKTCQNCFTCYKFIIVID